MQKVRRKTHTLLSEPRFVYIWSETVVRLGMCMYQGTRIYMLSNFALILSSLHFFLHDYRHLEIVFLLIIYLHDFYR